MCKDCGRKGGKRSAPSGSSVGADLIVLNPETVQWEGRGPMMFDSLPRIGEWVEIEGDGDSTMIRVVMIAHRGESAAGLYAVVEGRTVECLKMLSESG